jgi:hypothetical protein
MVRTRLLALAVTLLALPAGAAEASSFTFDNVYCFQDARLLNSSVVGRCESGANNAIRIQLTLDQPIDFSVSAMELTHQQFGAEAGEFSGSDCLGYVELGNCIEYKILPSHPINTSYTATLTFAWVLDTNAFAPMPLLIRAEGDYPGPYQSALDNQLYYPDAVPGIHFCDNPDTCKDDPGESGTTDNFSRFAVLNPVPEPGTLLLVGSGVAGAFWRRRRQCQRRQA